MKVILSLFLIASLVACDNELKHKLCLSTYNDYNDASNKMFRLDDDPLEKLYYSNLANMNLQILLHKDCCRWGDTCPSGIYDR